MQLITELFNLSKINLEIIRNFLWVYLNTHTPTRAAPGIKIICPIMECNIYLENRILEGFRLKRRGRGQKLSNNWFRNNIMWTVPECTLAFPRAHKTFSRIRYESFVLMKLESDFNISFHLKISTYNIMLLCFDIACIIILYFILTPTFHKIHC